MTLAEALEIILDLAHENVRTRQVEAIALVRELADNLKDPSE